MRVLAGTLLTPGGWIQGHAVIEAGRCAEVRAGPPPAPPVAEGVVVPAFVNAHTHVGDAVARGAAIPDDLMAAVGPGGYKQHVFATTAEAALVAGMAGALREAAAAGAAWVVDFREGSLAGLAQLRAARPPALGARVFARPSGPTLDPLEVRALLQEADGLSVSSVVDDPRALALAEAARAMGKGFALHASEGAREPLGPVLDTRPDFIVHLTHATRGDLDAMRAAGPRIVVCPRSNARWAKRLPDVRTMLDFGLRPAVGTDNAMLHPCDPRAEARALLELARDVAPDEALAMLSLHGWAIAQPGQPLPLQAGGPADLLVYRRTAGPPAADVLGGGATLLHREHSGGAA